MKTSRVSLASIVIASCCVLSAAAEKEGTTRANRVDALAATFRELPPEAYPEDQRDAARRMVREQQRERLQASNRRSSENWYAIETREQWEEFKTPRIEALRRSLGDFPARPEKFQTLVTRSLTGDGYTIENLIFQSRPGLWVTASLYKPADPPRSMPGLLICHSHHRPKEHGELQDMGMTWARAGCVVLVMDQLGHGERRQHPFRSASDRIQHTSPLPQAFDLRVDLGFASLNEQAFEDF